MLIAEKPGGVEEQLPGDSGPLCSQSRGVPRLPQGDGPALGPRETKEAQRCSRCPVRYRAGRDETRPIVHASSRLGIPISVPTGGAYASLP